MKGKTIRMYLVDGTATGMLTAEIINWTGKVLVSSRSRLPEVAKRDESRRTGVYFLVGQDPENPHRDCIYVGEGDNVVQRLVHHDKDEAKDFWSRTILVVSKDENLTKSHGRYLESRLIQMSKAAGRARLVNGTAPACPPLPEPDIADMEAFLQHIELILPAIGFSFLQPKPDVGIITDTNTASPLFSLNRVGATAKAREIDGEFVVMGGSTARRAGVESWTSYRGLRDQLVDDGKLVPASDEDFFEFPVDVPFSSPSAAASVIMARNANGRKEWKAEATGMRYGEWQESQLPEVDGDS